MVWIDSIQEYTAFIGDEKNNDLLIILFKHSTRCPISSRAYSEIVKFSESKSASTTLIGINVINNRDLSQYIAGETHINHESPQVIILKDKKVISSFSHFKITAEKLSLSIKEILTN